MKEVLKFLSQLAKNNNKEWFDENRKKYEESKKTVILLVEKILDELIKVDSALLNQKASSCLFRINKDVRFSKDKSPYKINFGASMSPGGRKSGLPGYYLQIQPNQSFLAIGTYQPEPEQLFAIRQEIDYNFDEFKKILSNSSFKKNFGGLLEEDKLKNVPKGFEKDTASLEYIKNRHFIGIHKLNDQDLTQNTIQKKCIEIFKSGIEFNAFLRRASS